MENIEEKQNAMDLLLDVISSSEKAPLDFKIMKIDTDTDKVYHDIMFSKNSQN